MHTFAITMLLGLALLKLLDVIEEVVPAVGRARDLVTVGLAVGGAFALDFSLFEGFGTSLREAWMGPLFTGLVIAGTTAVWAALLHWISPQSKEPVVSRRRDQVVTRAA